MSMEADRRRWAKMKWTWNKADARAMLQALDADLAGQSAEADLVLVMGVTHDGRLSPWLCTEDGEVYGPGYDNSQQCPPFNC